ncbi:MAG: alpha/beta fold hydrolase, partial [Acidobacteriota bacterium]
MTPTQSILRWATAVAVTLAGCAPSAAAAPETSATVAPAVHAIEWRPHTVEGGDGETLEAELGTLGVPENRSDPETETLTLHMVRLESSAERPAAPIVYLSGGPGASGIAAARWLFDTFKELTRTADVILLDQRGTGQSDRGLLCMNPDAELDPDLFNGDGQLAAAVELAATCRRDLEERSIDLAGYTTSESADDLDDLRRALGVPSISLLGFSYGTHLGLETIRRHGRHLERVVLIGAEGPDHTRKLPLTLDTQLRKLSLLAARQPAVAAEVPDMYALLLEVLAKLEKEPIPVPLELPD